MPQKEWKEVPNAADMLQVNEVLDLIEAHKHMGVTTASVMYSFLERRMQPLQKRCCLGFDYLSPKHPSRTCVEEPMEKEVMGWVTRVLLDLGVVPYVPTLYSAKNPPLPVGFPYIKYLSLELEEIVTESLPCLFRGTLFCTGVPGLFQKWTVRAILSQVHIELLLYHSLRSIRHQMI